jgi:hypothetical protein
MLYLKPLLRFNPGDVAFHENVENLQWLMRRAAFHCSVGYIKTGRVPGAGDGLSLKFALA